MEIARQGGKNELSAQLELLLMTLFMSSSKNLIKCAPTFKPQALISMARLKDRLNDAGFVNIWSIEQGHIIRLGNCRAVFLSAESSANVVGNTAHILLEIDESQDVSKDKYTKDFKPMGSTTNVTTVHYGTAWDDSTLLEEVKQGNLELERKDGLKALRYDWQEVINTIPITSHMSKQSARGWAKTTPFPHAVLPAPYSWRRRFPGCRKGITKENTSGAPPGKRQNICSGRRYRRRRKKMPMLTNNIRPGRDSTVITIGELDYSGIGELLQGRIVLSSITAGPVKTTLCIAIGVCSARSGTTAESSSIPPASG